MYNQIRKIMQESLEGINARILFGTVSGVNPFKVLIDQRFELLEQMLIFPQYIQEVKLQTQEREYILRPKLKVDDKLILINLGKQYLILDKVGDPNVTITITE